jgi:hypothetical protein
VNTVLKPLRPGCRVSFVVRELSRADFYRVQIGTHGGPSYSHDDLDAQEFELALTLGGGVAAAPSAYNYSASVVSNWISYCTSTWYWTRSRCLCLITEAQRTHSRADFDVLTGRAAIPGNPRHDEYLELESRC